MKIHHLPLDLVLYIDEFCNPYKEFFIGSVLQELKDYYQKCPKCSSSYRHFLYIIHKNYCSNSLFEQRKIQYP